MFTSDVKNTLISAGWQPIAVVENPSPNQILTHEEIEEWFKAQEEDVENKGYYCVEEAKSFGKGIVWVGAVSVLGLLMPLVAVSAGIAAIGFGCASGWQLYRERTYQQQQLILGRTERIWRSCRKDIAFLEMLRANIKLQKKEIKQAKNDQTKLEVVEKTEKKWEALKEILNTKPIKYEAAVLRRLVKKERNCSTLSQREKALRTIFKKCLKKEGKLDQLIQERENLAYNAFYEAVATREGEAYELYCKGLTLGNVPNLGIGWREDIYKYETKSI